MGTLAVVKLGSSISMAADTGSVQCDQMTGAGHHTICKIIAFNGSLIGISGAACARLAVEHYLEHNPMLVHFGSVSEIYSTWLAMHSVLRSDYFLNTNADEDTSYETSRMDVLVANETGAYAATAHRSVYQVLQFHAVGQGDQYALGAMHALYGQEDLSAEQIAIAAINAAAEFHTGTAAPVTVRTVRITSSP